MRVADVQCIYALMLSIAAVDSGHNRQLMERRSSRERSTFALHSVELIKNRLPIGRRFNQSWAVEL